MIADQFLQELVQESETTRRFLERIPEDQLDWRPHEKSMTVGQLGLHIAQSTGNVAQMAQADEFPMPDFSQGNQQPESLKEILTAFDESLSQAQKILPTFSDEAMGNTWSVKIGDQVVFAVPRAGMLRMIMCNHVYHHRGQLGVYLRLLGCKVPSSYGPSGDELPAYLAEHAAS